MALVLPTPPSVDPRLVIHGGPGSRILVGAYTANGGDVGSLADLGAMESSVVMQYARTMFAVECEQMLAAYHAFAIHEDITVKASFQQLNLANVYAMEGTTDQALTGGTVSDVASSLGFGQSITTRFYQLVLQTLAPAAATAGIRLYQFWKAYVENIGPVTFDRKKNAFQEITWRCLVDNSAIAAGKPPVFQILDS